MKELNQSLKKLSKIYSNFEASENLENEVKTICADLRKFSDFAALKNSIDIFFGEKMPKINNFNGQIIQFKLFEKSEKEALEKQFSTFMKNFSNKSRKILDKQSSYHSVYEPIGAGHRYESLYKSTDEFMINSNPKLIPRMMTKPESKIIIENNPISYLNCQWKWLSQAGTYEIFDINLINLIENSYKSQINEIHHTSYENFSKKIRFLKDGSQNEIQFANKDYAHRQVNLNNPNEFINIKRVIPGYFGWYWKSTSDCIVRYDEDTCLFLEYCFFDWMRNGQIEKYSVSINGSNSRTYKIFFKTNKQVNVNTGSSRDIIRIRSEKPNLKMANPI